jgi:hypothetical protein
MLHVLRVTLTDRSDCGEEKQLIWELQMNRVAGLSLEMLTG